MPAMHQRIMHLDMDAFYASVEALDNPELRGKPVVVGGTGPRSVVCACSYETRPAGVRSAMPMRRARELCPDAVVIRPRMERYREISRGIFEHLGREIERIEKMSVDEAYLDIDVAAPSDEAAMELGRRFKREIRDTFGLNCSIGIAPCKFISKIASDLKKPDALVLVRAAEVLEFLAPLGVERIPGVGKVGTRKLHSMDVRTIGDLRRLPREMLHREFGKWGEKLYDFARGIDPRVIVTRRERKSLGAETTFDRDVRDLDVLREHIARLSEKVAGRLGEMGLGVHTVTLKLRYEDFTSITRQESFDYPVRRAEYIASAAADQLRRTEAGARRVRLVGVSVSNFAKPSESGELPLF